MAATSGNDDNQLQIKLSGDLGEFEITEEDSESEIDDDSSKESVPGNALSTIPLDLVKTSAQAVFGSVQVSQSENVQFGNNVYFNGPVTIKQIVQSNEQDNLGYEHDESNTDKAESRSAAVHIQKSDSKEDAQIKPLKLQLWLKLSFTAICFIIVAGACAVATVSLTFIGHDNTTLSTTGYDDQDTTTSCMWVDRYSTCLKLMFILISLVLVCLVLWVSRLLTSVIKKGTGDGKQAEQSKLASAGQSGTYNVEADPLFIAPTHLRIVSRDEWLAQPVEKPLDKIRLPVPWVIIQHTATESCHTQSECVLRVRLIQMFHIESRGWYDIGYNFLVAGDGSAYYGRGWEYQGAHTLGYNKYSMGIAFIGTFNNEPPPKKQLDACKKLIQRGVELGKIAKDYKLFAHRQLLSSLSPGDKLVDILKEWPNFVKNFTNVEEVLPNY